MGLFVYIFLNSLSYISPQTKDGFQSITFKEDTITDNNTLSAAKLKAKPQTKLWGAKPQTVTLTTRQQKLAEKKASLHLCWKTDNKVLLVPRFTEQGVPLGRGHSERTFSWIIASSASEEPEGAPLPKTLLYRHTCVGRGSPLDT